jgi:hypothetical protein
MALDEDLLGQARAAEARLIDAERTVIAARDDFHQAVRRLQLAGGSLREIADALGISHQRVHQIVEGAGGGRPWRSRMSSRRAGGAAWTDPALLTCSFCGKAQKQARKLIAGPGIYICDTCIELADRVIATGEVAATPLSEVKPLGEEAATARCSFCGKHRHKVAGLAAAAAGAICNECLELCREIITEEERG